MGTLLGTPKVRVSAASRMIALKPAVGSVSGSTARLSSVTPSASNARRKNVFSWPNEPSHDATCVAARPASIRPSVTRKTGVAVAFQARDHLDHAVTFQNASRFAAVRKYPGQ